jgi:SAM-dependent methyltransferase
MQLRPTGDDMRDDGSVSEFSSAAYWEGRYRVGGNSGAGSYGRLAMFKAAFVNGFVALNDIGSVIEFGCGDGNQLGLLSVRQYTGVDVSATVLERCRAQFPQHRFVDPAGLTDVPTATLGLSMDVVFHLTEDSVFEAYMADLFERSADYVIIYSSDCDARPADRHVRHRLVSDYVRCSLPHWSLLARVPNAYPFNPLRPHDTSFSDFMVFGRGHRDCLLRIPAAC